MNTVNELQARREAIIREMLSIRSMRRGTINEQYLGVRHKGVRQPVLRGPYYILSRREGKKTVSQRLTSGEQLQQAREDVEAYQRFMVLCKEFTSITEKLGQLEHEGDRSKELEAEKKRRRLRSSKTPR